jgi:hypothetical protein
MRRLVTRHVLHCYVTRRVTILLCMYRWYVVLRTVQYGVLI